MKTLKKPGLYFGIVALLLSAFLFLSLIRLNVLPTMFVGMIGVLLLIVVCLVFLLALSKHLVVSIIGCVLAVVLALGSGLGSYYLINTSGALSTMTQNKTIEKHAIVLYALKTSPLKSEDDLKGQTIGILKNNARKYTDKAYSELKSYGKKFTVQEYDSTIQLVNDFKGQKIDLMMIDSSNLSMIEDLEGQENIEDEIKAIYSYNYTVKKADTSTTTDVTSKAFNVLISGSDSRDSVDETSRSDVDMIVTVNPKTRTVLMTSIPRDYYVTTVCDESMGCANGQKDKLTHTGLHGVGTTEMTIENFMDIDINYNVKVGFQTVMQLVDTLGGITVNNPQDFSTGEYTFKQGNIELNGSQALAFARERYSFASGDRERGKNQMRVLTGILNKLMSPSILTNYASIMQSLASTFHTNMGMDDISALVKSQLNNGGSWKIYSNSLDGNGGTDYCYELGDNASVVYPDENSISEAKTDIEAVTMGEEPPYVISQ